MRTIAYLILVALAPLRAMPGDIGQVSEVPFTILRTSSIPLTSSGKNELVVVHSAAEFHRLWARLKLQPQDGGSDSAPGVNFHRSTVVGFLGAFGASCDPYQLLRVTESYKRVTLLLSHENPGGSCTCASFVGQPYIIVKVPATRKQIDFAVEDATRECE